MSPEDHLATQLRERAQQNAPFCFSRVRCFDFNLIRPGDMEYQIVDAFISTANDLTLILNDGLGEQSELHLEAPSGLTIKEDSLIVLTARRFHFKTIELWSEDDQFHYRDGQCETLIEPSSAPLLTLSA